MKIIGTPLPGVMLIEPRVFEDARGFLIEQWHCDRYFQAGFPDHFVQDNLSFSHQNTLRGLHFQNPHPQAKLVSVLGGEIYDVVVDVRVGSPTFKKWVGNRLSLVNKRQVFIPEGFAHGFCVLTKTALVSYKCTALYDPACQVSLVWNDPELQINWPLIKPILSPQDAKAPRLRELVAAARLPSFHCAV